MCGLMHYTNTLDVRYPLKFSIFRRYKVADVRAIVEKYENIAETLDTVKDKEQFLLNCKSIFHPNHFIPFLIKFSLCMVSDKTTPVSINYC